MFFENEKLMKFFAIRFNWSDDQVQLMMQQYYGTISRLIINESIDYIDVNNLPEKAEFEKLLESKATKRSDPQTEAELAKYVAGIHHTYPELQEKIRTSIAEIDNSLLKDTVAMLSEEDAIEVLKIMNHDLDNIQRFSEQYLNPTQK